MKHVKTSILSLVLMLGLIACATTGTAQAGQIWSKNGVAIAGYDLVSYHTKSRAEKGYKKFMTKYNGTKYYFTSAENRDKFKDTPSKFLPAYDGYCAFAVGKMNKKVPPNPKEFKFHNGRLLLFFHDNWEGKMFNTKVPWNQHETSLYSAAQKNWKKLK